MENPVCGPSTRAEGAPESDMMTVKGAEKGKQQRVKTTAKVRSEEEEMAILRNGVSSNVQEVGGGVKRASS